MSFLKWAGGKRQLVPKLLELLPPDISARRYIEPMVGGGALFFALQENKTLRDNSRALLADTNVSLMCAYHQVRNNAEEIINYLQHWKAAEYDIMREAFNSAIGSGRMETTAQAARFIWLNKMCFNGIYRVNKDGLFNVPKGSRTELPVIDSTIRKASEALRFAEFRVASFEDTIHAATVHDFVYFDPPYLGDFTTYTEDGFDLGEWARLRWVCGKLNKMKIPWMLSSNAHPAMQVLFGEYNITVVSALRAVNSDGKGRGAVQEFIIRNYG